MDFGRVANRSQMFERGYILGGKGKCLKRGYILRRRVDFDRASYRCLKGVYSGIFIYIIFILYYIIFTKVVIIYNKCYFYVSIN